MPQSIYNWTGFYVGGHAGYGKGMKDYLNSSFDYQVKGFLGGGQVGYNQQVGNLVFGIEADASWGNIKGDQTLNLGGALIGFTQTGVASTTIDGLATLTGRLGLAQDRWLVYVKGGAAWAHERHNLADQRDRGRSPPITQSINANGSEDRLGYVFGIGSEWAFWGNWSFKSEYNYVHLGTREVRFTGSQTTARCHDAVHDRPRYSAIAASRQVRGQLPLRSRRAAHDCAGAPGAGLQLDRRLGWRADRLRMGWQELAGFHSGR